MSENTWYFTADHLNLNKTSHLQFTRVGGTRVESVGFHVTL